MNRAVLAGMLSLALCACGETSKESTTHSAPSSSSAAADGHAMPQVPTSIAGWAEGAQLFEGLGSAHRAVTSSSNESQQYFDQGLRLMWAFNHDESTRSFAKAAELDPNCALCYWGVAFTVGPNYNMPMMASERAKVAWDALVDAQQHAASASPIEKGLIAALSKRFVGDQPLDPSNVTPLLVAYADAMKVLAQEYPDDADVQTLYAESLMSIRAWKLWSADGKPAEGTEAAVAALERALASDPEHPGANHYYVHALEASPNPARALVAAERLTGMMPAAGHLVHMPAHIMQRVGRYKDASEANRKAAVADETYYAKTRAPDYYPMYTGHNYQFLAASAAMEGRQAETLKAVADMRRAITDEMLLTWPGYDWMYMSLDYTTCVRFGRWDDMLAKPAPNPKLPVLVGAYLFGRTVSFAAKGRIGEAKAALTELEDLSATLPPDALAGFSTAKDVFGIAIAVAKARIANAENRPGDAIALLEDAIAREDTLPYNEPPDWFVPARHDLGAVLLATGDAAKAETVYRRDLDLHPENGWALFGLVAALRQQGETTEAEAVQQRFDAAWSNADVTITASAF